MPRIAKRIFLALLASALAIVGWYLIKTSVQPPPLSVRVLALEEGTTGVSFFYEIKNEADHPVCITARYGVGKAVDPPINAFDIRDLQNSLPIVLNAGEVQRGLGALFKPAPPGTPCRYYYTWEPVWQFKVKQAWRWLRPRLGLQGAVRTLGTLPTPLSTPCELPPESKGEFQRLRRLSEQSTSKSHSQSPRP